MTKIKLANDVNQRAVLIAKIATNEIENTKKDAGKNKGGKANAHIRKKKSN